MAINRNSKRLINLHSSAYTADKAAELASALSFGEIAVVHKSGAPALYIKMSDEAVAEFIDKSAVQALISNEGVGALETRVLAVENKLSGVTTVTGYVATEIEKLDVTANTSDAVNGISISVTETDGKVDKPSVSVTPGSVASGDTSVVLGGAVFSAIESASSDLETAINNAKTAATAYTKSEIEALDVTANTSDAVNGLTVAVTEVDGKVEKPVLALTVGEIASGDTNITTGKKVFDYIEGLAVNTDVATIKNQLSGFSTSNGSVKDYIDSAVTSVYKVKGSVADYAALTAVTNPTEGDVYNVIAANGNTPAGTNYVWNGSAWDALGGTIDLSPYAIASAVNETTSALDTRIGTLEGLTATTNSALQSISKGTDGDYVTTTVGTKSNNNQTVGVAVTVVDLTAATTSNKGLAEASDVKGYVDGAVSGANSTLTQAIEDETTARQNADSAITAQIGTGFSSSSTIADQLDAVKTTADASLSSVTSGNSYISVGAKADRSQAISANVVEVSAATATGSLADAKSVKDYVDSVSGNLSAVDTRVGTIEGAYVTGASVTGISGVSATLEGSNGKNIKLDFSDMVIDCGEF